MRTENAQQACFKILEKRHRTVPHRTAPTAPHRTAPNRTEPNR